MLTEIFLTFKQQQQHKLNSATENVSSLTNQFKIFISQHLFLESSNWLESSLSHHYCSGIVNSFLVDINWVYKISIKLTALAITFLYQNNFYIFSWCTQKEVAKQIFGSMDLHNNLFLWITWITVIICLLYNSWWWCGGGEEGSWRRSGWKQEAESYRRKWRWSGHNGEETSSS